MFTEDKSIGEVAEAAADDNPVPREQRAQMCSYERGIYHQWVRQETAYRILNGCASNPDWRPEYRQYSWLSR